ncbi:MAG: hypothetical protein Q7R46_01430 [bacterium]|nr:hypothetical protein [bacterium]
MSKLTIDWILEKLISNVPFSAVSSANLVLPAAKRYLSLASDVTWKIEKIKREIMEIKDRFRKNLKFKLSLKDVLSGKFRAIVVAIILY